MPHLDKRTGEIVLRVIYDGAPEAGKTTNVRELGNTLSLQRRGAAASPGTTGPRTQFFDWLDFSGGFVDGRRVRCQLVSVPGQSELLHRRRYLLETADSVVIVVDSQREPVLEARAHLDRTRQILEMVTEVPVKIVVQANKQDQPGALPVSEIGELLGLDAATQVLPAVAVQGAGLMETFILASRLATERLRAFHGEDPPDLAPGQEDPEALHASMLSALESLEQDRATPSAPPEPALRIEWPAGTPRSPNSVPEEALRALHPGLELSAGQVWPPVKGRALLAGADFSALQVPELAEPWAPPSPIELRTHDGWIFHSSRDWFFEDATHARNELLALVRTHISWAEFLPESRAVFLSGGEGNFRLWVLTARVEQTLRDALITAFEERDRERVQSLLESTARFAERWAEIARTEPIAADQLMVDWHRHSAHVLLACRGETGSLDLLSELSRFASAFDGVNNPRDSRA